MNPPQSFPNVLPPTTILGPPITAPIPTPSVDHTTGETGPSNSLESIDGMTQSSLSSFSHTWGFLWFQVSDLFVEEALLSSIATLLEQQRHTVMHQIHQQALQREEERKQIFVNFLQNQLPNQLQNHIIKVCPSFLTHPRSPQTQQLSVRQGTVRVWEELHTVFSLPVRFSRVRFRFVAFPRICLC